MEGNNMDNILDFMDQISLNELIDMRGKSGITDKLIFSCKNEQGILMLVNVDNFEMYNDIFGSETGDRLLDGCAAAISANVGADDIMGRVGGDEFIVFSKAIVDKVAFARAFENINQKVADVSKRLIGEDVRFSMGVSIGAVFVPEQGTEYEELFHKAAVALGNVKDAGARGCAFYSDTPGGGGDTTVIDRFEFISKGLDEEEQGSGALWLEYEYFSIVYRFFRRYIQTYNGGAAKVLITVTKRDESLDEQEFAELTRTIGRIVNSSLRRSDIMMQSRRNQFFLLLPEMPEQYIEKVFTRIMDQWGKTEYFDKADIKYEVGMLKA